MLECCSIVTCCILSAIMLLITDSWHSCFACHLQTVHPFPVIFISISTEIISSFQWHACFAKLLPCASFFFRSTHMHRISYLPYHTCFASCCLRISRCWLWFRLFVFLSWVEPGDEFVNENLLSTLTRIKLSTTLRILQARWPPLEITSIFALLVVRSIAMLRYLPLAISCLPYCHVSF